MRTDSMLLLVFPVRGKLEFCASVVMFCAQTFAVCPLFSTQKVWSYIVSRYLDLSQQKPSLGFKGRTALAYKNN